LLLRKLCWFGFSDGYVNWFHSYITSRRSRVLLSGNFSRLFRLTSGVPQSSVLGPFLFNVFINDLCDSIKYSNSLTFVDDLKIVVKSPLQSDINSVIIQLLLWWWWW
jgi:hypothetical protein